MKVTGKMNKICFGINPVLIIFLLLVNIINVGYSKTVPNKEDIFRINVTMKNYETKAVEKNAMIVFFFYVCCFSSRKMNMLLYNMNYLMKN